MSDFFSEEHFDANTVEPVSNDFELIPANTIVTAQIIECTQAPISGQSDKGDCLVLTWQIVEGDYVNRQIWQRLNVKARNFEGSVKSGKSSDQATADAISRARAELSAVCHAVGVPTPTRNDDLCFRPTTVKIGVKKSDNPQYKDQNTVIIPKSSFAGASAPAQSRVNAPANNGQAAQQPRGNVPAFMQGRR